jgi:hypothetical protein
MITQQQYESVVERSAQMLQQAGIVLTPEERARFEVADFGLGELEKTDLEIITYVYTVSRHEALVPGGAGRSDRL